MRIAITADGPNLDAKVDPRFGRCQYFVIVDPQTLDFEAMENSSSTAGGGAGISAAQMVAGKQVEAILTGNIGPNAYEVLSAVGVKVMTGVSGKIRNAIAKYKAGILSAADSANVASHSGLGRVE